MLRYFESLVKYAVDFHARGRTLVECEIFARDKNLKVTSVVKMRGYISRTDPLSVVATVPESKNTFHRFSTFDPGDGYGYEGSVSARHGWRIKLSQIKQPETT